MFERAYMDYHQDRFVDASLFILLKGRPIAVLPACRIQDDVVSHAGLTFGGLLSGPDLTTARAIDTIEMVSDRYRSEGVKRLVYKPMPYPYQLMAAQEDLYALYVAGARIEPRQLTTAIAPNTNPAFSQERRRGIIRAARHGLEIGESDRFAEFMDLLSEVLESRHGATPVHTLEEILLLKSRFPGDIRLFVALEDQEIVAGTVIFATSLVAHAQYIAASNRGREVAALDAVFHLLITETFNDRWFDFGISNERDGSINHGLLHNKESYGARAVIHDRYVLQIP